MVNVMVPFLCLSAVEFEPETIAAEAIGANKIIEPASNIKPSNERHKCEIFIKITRLIIKLLQLQIDTN